MPDLVLYDIDNDEKFEITNMESCVPKNRTLDTLMELNCQTYIIQPASLHSQ